MLGLSTLPAGQTAAADQDTRQTRRKALFFTRCPIWGHDCVTRHGDELSMCEEALVELGLQAGCDVVCTKDGAVFDGDLDQYDAFLFYATGDLTGECETPQPGVAMSPAGKERLMAAVEAGKGFVGIHSATTCFMRSDSESVDPYTAMIGAEFINHDEPQRGTMRVVSPSFPGVQGLGSAFSLHDEWYAQRKFANDLHVILVQETAGMQGAVYQRPPYPATWARMHGKGRVFYTSMGHENIRSEEAFRQVLLGGIEWALRNVEADVTPNIAEVTPRAGELAK